MKVLFVNSVCGIGNRLLPNSESAINSVLVKTFHETSSYRGASQKGDK
ncbi:hypothetical protein J5681_01270 [bacterium]|nr:hypothetical protein [bacterium]